MFEKFTERARKVMSLSRQQAQSLNSEVIGTEHILLGILQEGGGVAAKALQHFRVDLKRVHTEIARLVTPSPNPLHYLGQIPFSPQSKRVIELAGEEASREALEVIGTGQLLIGCLEEGQGIAAQVLTHCDVTLPMLQKIVHDMENEAKRVAPDTRAPENKIRIRMFKKGGNVPGTLLIVNGISYVEGSSVMIEGLAMEGREAVLDALAKQRGADAVLVEDAPRPD